MSDLFWLLLFLAVLAIAGAIVLICLELSDHL